MVRGDSISVRRKPSNFRKALSGIAKGLYPQGLPAEGTRQLALGEYFSNATGLSRSIPLTMTELLVAPYRVSSQERADEFYALLSAYPHLEWLPLTLEIADIAARTRAKHRLHTPDAILAATAIDAGATALITNDSAFDRVEAFETAVLDRYL